MVCVFVSENARVYYRYPMAHKQIFLKGNGKFVVQQEKCHWSEKMARAKLLFFYFKPAYLVARVTGDKFQPKLQKY